METVDRLSLQTRATRFVNIHIYASWWARVLPGTSRISYNLVVPGMSMSGNLSPSKLVSCRDFPICTYRAYTSVRLIE